jgi:hypothetical protein
MVRPPCGPRCHHVQAPTGTTTEGYTYAVRPWSLRPLRDRMVLHLRSVVHPPVAAPPPLARPDAHSGCSSQSSVSRGRGPCFVGRARNFDSIACNKGCRGSCQLMMCAPLAAAVPSPDSPRPGAPARSPRPSHSCRSQSARYACSRARAAPLRVCAFQYVVCADCARVRFAGLACQQS